MDCNPYSMGLHISEERQGPIPETIQSLLITWSDLKFLTSLRFHDHIGFHERSWLRSHDDPGDPARYVNRCWIRHMITTIDYFINNIAIVKIHKLPGNIYWNLVYLVRTVCIFSKMLVKYTYLSNMACPNRVVSWATLCLCIISFGMPCASGPSGISTFYRRSQTLKIISHIEPQH